jgi:hypothetical protein
MSKKYENFPENLRKVLAKQENENFYENLQSQSKEQLAEGIQNDLKILDKILKNNGKNKK